MLHFSCLIKTFLAYLREFLFNQPNKEFVAIICMKLFFFATHIESESTEMRNYFQCRKTKFCSRFEPSSCKCWPCLRAQERSVTRWVFKSFFRPVRMLEKLSLHSFTVHSSHITVLSIKPLFAGVPLVFSVYHFWQLQKYNSFVFQFQALYNLSDYAFYTLSSEV